MAPHEVAWITEATSASTKFVCYELVVTVQLEVCLATCSVVGRLAICGNNYSQGDMSLNEWNKLVTDCVTASSVNMFKNKLDTYLRRAGYT